MQSVLTVFAAFFAFAAVSGQWTAVIDALPKTVPNCAVVSSEGLKNQDAHHFDRASRRVLATRYYEEFKKCATR